MGVRARLVLAGGFVMIGVLAIGAGADARAADAIPRIAAVSKASGRASSSRIVTFTGVDLSAARAVYLGKRRLAHLERVSDTELRAEVDHAPQFAAGSYAFSLLVGGTMRQSDATFTYLATTPADRQLRYLSANLDRRTATTAYAFYPGNDCANFVSQTLHARGWPFTGSWRPGARDWVSSTALRSYLLDTRRVQEYPDTQANRSLVRVGDVIQFDWDRSGDRDHSGIVTRVRRDPKSGFTTISYSAHTDARPPHDNNSPSRDLSIEQSTVNHQGYYKLKKTGRAYFLHILKG